MSISLHIGSAARAVGGLCGLALVLALTGCDKDPAAEAPISSAAIAAAADTSSAQDDATDSPDGASGTFIVLPGTGRYAIGTEAPYGGYQLHGEPDSQPAGCTWSIQDEDGVAVFENQGQYAFLTDIKEAVTFVSDGCPDWEQFQ